jgi:hypothetical protein
VRGRDVVGHPNNETPDYADLASRIRTAFREFHLTLDVTKDFPRGEDDEITDAFLDEVLLDGEPVQLVKATPRADLEREMPGVDSVARAEPECRCRVFRKLSHRPVRSVRTAAA